jgi:hypothetical protein
LISELLGGLSPRPNVCNIVLLNSGGSL